jgi:Lar family restriction alleviation protein
MSGQDHVRRHLDKDQGQPLAACPFCASRDVGYYEHVYARHFAVVCHSCSAEGPLRPSCEEAGQLWNRRLREG